MRSLPSANERQLKRPQRWTYWGACVREAEFPSNFIFSLMHSCIVKPHLCGKRCKLSGKLGCLESCAKVSRSCSDHVCSPLIYCMLAGTTASARRAHVLSASTHVRRGKRVALYPGQLNHGNAVSLALRSAKIETARRGELFLPWSLHYPQARSSLVLSPLLIELVFSSGLNHQVHSCDMKQCPAKCSLCNKPCKEAHLHGLKLDVHHLCGSVFVL